MFIDSLLEAHPERKKDPDTRETIRQQLRSANPRGRRFARLKYSDIYETAREAYLSEFRDRLKKRLQNAFDKTFERLETLDALDEKVSELLTTADDLSTENITDFVKLLSESSRIQKTRRESINALVELSDRITGNSLESDVDAFRRET